MSEKITSFDAVIDVLQIQAHILHLWLKKFPILQKRMSEGGENGFSMWEVSLLKGLKYFLVDESKSVKYVQTLLNEKGADHIRSFAHQKNNLTTKTSLKNSLKMARDSPKKLPKKLLDIFSKQSKDTKITPTKEGETATEEGMSTTENTQTPSTEQEKVNFDSFEKRWRHFMQDKGKLSLPSNHDAQYSLDEIPPEDEIIFIDEEDIDIAENITSAPKNQSKKTFIEDIERQEKIAHILTKIAFLRADLIHTKDIIQDTLTSFGNSNVESVYVRFDEEP